MMSISRSPFVAIIVSLLTGATVVNWAESKKTMKLMRWLFTSEEGKDYQKRLTSALREGR